MIIVKLIGGLGNQLFQYSIARAFAERLNCPIKLDVTGYENQDDYTPRSFELGKLNIKESFATTDEINKLKLKKSKLPGLLRKLYKIPKYSLSKSYIEEKHFHFDPKMIELSGNNYIEGYWQSEKYFKQIRTILLNEFSLQNDLNADNITILNKIRQSNSISLHVRRGDYVSNPGINKCHGVCSLDYYKQAIDYLSKKVENPHLFLFSDDMDWVKENLNIEQPFTTVDINDSNNGIYDLELMKNCKHNIIANSSFSWWGAWLNNNYDKIVIAPQKWFNGSDKDTKDLVPEEWLKL